MNHAMQDSADVVICGAGIAGLAAAYFLAVRGGVGRVVLVDERPPLSLTSDKSTEAYRNWWPGPGRVMVQLMNRSIDLLEALAEASDNVFQLNRRGYVYLAATPAGAEQLLANAQTIAGLGAGALRQHPGREPYLPAPAHGFHNQPGGADYLPGDLLRQQFPFLTAEVQAGLHARRCGWLSAQQLGTYWLEQVKGAGGRLLPGRVTGVQVRGGRVVGVQLNGDTTLATGCFVNAAGPYLAEVGQMLGVGLPVFNELHLKMSFSDTLGVVPRDVPMMIWDEPLALPWSAEERAELAGDPEMAWLLETLPAGLHFRPEGGGGSPILLMLWPYHTGRHAPVWPPPPPDALYPEVLLRGMSRMVPGLAAYLGRAGRPYIDQGYYCKTVENRPLIGPLPVTGAFVIGALSGYGIMAAPAAGELLAAHVTGRGLPDYAPALQLARYQDSAYQALLAGWGETGQL